MNTFQSITIIAPEYIPKKSFPIKLFETLNSCPYVQWSEDGSNFTIFDVDRFESEVLVPNFNNSCMLSFSRQLHIYGFQRLLDGRRTRYQFPTNYAKFYHPFFKRNRPELVINIKRKPRPRNTPKNIFIDQTSQFTGSQKWA
ncbi:winged helix DNA-binding domain-containing protein [Conidiobolus coronatus NRRL 28638]|uniref:Winged helix DNA-binding domain-containing protein n=1 Tax=Conidiobolus coronatus (strain ATCC 28846 / CBS 209.66 / NRRL 28638) TaxID=796925 RepID=A0A137NQY9_CONC2|nr:winged helix DNA-binding domain-containing protein [Conidiobolus coronatus NRRL 28638]|eukprot:KXN65132.1 winged helix DNA-binding domain-containing protein [Conidiobolus coronatus NRRL 28638]